MLWFFECCQVLRLLELAEPHCYFLVQQIEQGGAAARPDTEIMSVLFLEFQLAVSLSFVTEVGQTVGQLPGRIGLRSHCNPFVRLIYRLVYCCHAQRICLVTVFRARFMVEDGYTPRYGFY